jgi:hypothetical protein
VLGNWVKETTATTGTGNITLAGAATGFASFDSQWPNATLRYFSYIIESGNNRELGIGHLTSSTTLVRDKVLATLVSGAYTRYTGAGTPITLAGTSTVYCDNSAEQADLPGVVLGSTDGVCPEQLSGNVDGTAGRDGGYQWCFPFTLPISGSYTAARIRISATASAALKVGIYDIGTNGYPDRLIANRATGLTLTTGIQDVSFDSAVFLQARKWYYFSILSDNTPTYYQMSGYGGFRGGGPLSSDSANMMPATTVFLAQTYSSGLLSPYSGTPTKEAARGMMVFTLLRT